MRARFQTLAAAPALMAALLAIGACSKTPKPKDLPPPPPAQNGAPTPPPSMGGDQMGGARPGSRADMIAQAGSDTVHFALDSSDVDAEGQGILAAQAAWLKKNPSVRVTVEGHCDERGTREYNLALGDRRANAAKNILVNAGVDPGRISVISYGKEHPVATGDDEAAFAQNRRAVTVVPD